MGKLMIVDDNELIRESVAAVFFASGYDVVKVNNGLDALVSYEETFAEIKLVLMDVEMPRLDGISATKGIKIINPRAKVILMSGHTDQIPPCADAFLTKPFRSRDLLETIQLVLQED